LPFNLFAKPSNLTPKPSLLDFFFAVLSLLCEVETKQNMFKSAVAGSAAVVLSYVAVRQARKRSQGVRDRRQDACWWIEWNQRGGKSLAAKLAESPQLRERRYQAAFTAEEMARYRSGLRCLLFFALFLSGALPIPDSNHF